MPKIYKIHPAIGISRVGKSDSFFLAPETPGGPALELAGPVETPLTQFKDSNKLIKRQGVRFRIYEYDQPAAGVPAVLQREITSAEASIEWKVEVANRKAAGQKILGNGTVKRNAGVTDRASLAITPGALSISGNGQAAREFASGKFLGKTVKLGAIGTDAKGRLVFLGGFGEADSVPTGKPIVEFANNDLWYDDVSDGPVTASVKFPGQAAVPVGSPAWVVCAPPDFAPQISGIVTLYDIALQAAIERGFLAAPSQISFMKDILPILVRAVTLRWVNQFSVWNGISRDWAKLSDKNLADGPRMRKKVFDLVSAPPLNQLELTATQLAAMKRWRDGDFTNDFTAAAPVVPPVTPDGLDRVALEACAGGGFFPGIEGPAILKNKQLYSEAFRLDHAALQPGGVTEQMAVPWQADFMKCGGTWWPSQRPDSVFLNPAAARPQAQWMAGIRNHVHLVENFNRLGFVVPAGLNPAGEMRYVETERDPTFARV